MDGSTNELNRFITSEDEDKQHDSANVSEVAKPVTPDSTSAVAERPLYDDVSIIVPAKVVHGRRQWGYLCYTCGGRRCRLCLICFLSLVLVALIGLLVLFLLFGENRASLARAQSTGNFSLFLAVANGTNSSKNIPQGRGKPFWSNCGDSSLSVVEAVFTKDCELQENRCLVPEDSEGSLEIIFTPKRLLSHLRMDVTGCMGFFCVPRQLSEPNACLDSNLDCPLDAGNTYLYRSIEKAQIGIPVVTNLDVDSRLTLVDLDTNEIVLCVIIYVRVVPA